MKPGRFAHQMLHRKISFISMLFVHLCSEAQSEYKKFYYENGVMSSEGLMRDGQPDGYWKTYYPDGGLKSEGNRKSFQLDSTWTFYRDDSTTERCINYLSGVKHGIEQVFDMGAKLKEQYTYAANVKNGEAKFYYPDGSLWKKLNYENNKEEGKAMEYAEDGRIITLLTYRNGFIYSEQQINRFNSEGKRTGVWQDLYANGQLKEEGPWTNGLRNGIFKFFDKKGDLDKMEKYDNGELVTADGDATEAIIDLRKEYDEEGNLKMTGSYSGGKKNGTFREYDKTGQEINGYYYQNDVLLGEGMVDSLGRRTGQWKLYHNTGEQRAIGKYENGKKEGKWTYYFTNGKTEQQGEYRLDAATGHWEWFFADGRQHRDEYYRKGREDGHAIEYDSTGMVINEGDYIDGNKNGVWKLTVNDHTEEGEYLDGERQGEWVWKYADGQKAFVGEYQAGIPVGKHKYYYANGMLKMKGEYQGGELQGKWEYYLDTGAIELVVDYEGGLATAINGQKIKLPETKEEN
ncbi:MAG: toxin-antitoxin system YwqK family antitoxin [Flavobacteriales bacterium]